MKSSVTGRKTHPLAARIKRLMQRDNEVGRIASVTPTLISRALELFLRKLCTNVFDRAQSRNALSVSPSHLKAYISSEEIMDFLKYIVKDVPDLQGEVDCPTVPKRRRSAAETKGVHRRSKAGSVKRVCGEQTLPSQTPAPKSSIFADFTQRGPTPFHPQGSQRQIKAAKTRTRQNSGTETKGWSGFVDKGMQIANAYSMMSAFRSSESTTTQIVDLSTLPISVQKALMHFPRNASSYESVQSEVEDPSNKLDIRSEFNSSRKRSVEEISPHHSSEWATSASFSFDERWMRSIKAEDDDYDLED